MNTLATMDAAHGYWVRSIDGETATLRMIGLAQVVNQPIQLESGWNLVSYLPEQTLPITTALQSIAGKYTVVLGSDGGGRSYYPELSAELNTLTVMTPGAGYWVRMSEAATLVYPTSAGSLPAGLTSRDSGPTLTADRMALTPWWVNFYGTAMAGLSAPLDPGTEILAINTQEIVCGSAVVGDDGQFGLLPCYGLNPTAAGSGETIRFETADGVYLGTAKWTSFGALQELKLMRPTIIFPLIFKNWGG